MGHTVKNCRKQTSKVTAVRLHKNKNLKVLSLNK